MRTTMDMKKQNTNFCSSLDYSDYIKKNVKNFKSKRKFAVFIDTYLPFHPEHYDTQNKFINADEYFSSLVSFLSYLKKQLI